MRAKRRPEPLRKGERATKRKGQYFNQPNLTPGALERATKNWAIDKLAEHYFDGQNSPQHRLALGFWEKSGRKLRNV